MQPHHFSMVVCSGKLGDEKGERGNEQRIDKRKDKNEGEKGFTGGKREEENRERKKKKAEVEEIFYPAVEKKYEGCLGEDRREAVEGDNIEDLRFGEAELLDKKDLKGFDEKVPAKNEEEIGEDEVFGDGKDLAETESGNEGFRRFGMREGKGNGKKIEKRYAAADEKEGKEVGKLAGEIGAEGKAQAEHEVGKTKIFGPFVVVGKVGDDGVDR